MYPLTIGLAIAAKDISDEVRGCLDGLPVRVVIDHQDLGDLAPFLDRMERMRPDVVLLDLGRLADPLEDLLAKLRGIDPETMVIALHTSAEPDVILGAIRAGANEYLYPPLRNPLLRALERKSSERSRRRDGVHAGGKNLAFFSAKGGCGATTLACHVAVELGRQGQKVLLADLDLASGMVGFLTKSKSTYSVLDALQNLHRLDAHYWKGLVSNGIANLEIISAPPLATPKQQIQGVKHEGIRHVLGFVRSQYDWTILDLGRSLSQLALHTLDEIDEAYLVTTLDVPALHQAKQIIQSLLDTGYGKSRLRLVLNRVPKQLDITPEELEKMLGIRINAMLPDCYTELYEAYSEGKLASHTSNLGRYVKTFAGKLAGLEPNEKPKSKFLFF